MEEVSLIMSYCTLFLKGTRGKENTAHRYLAEQRAVPPLCCLPTHAADGESQENSLGNSYETMSFTHSSAFIVSRVIERASSTGSAGKGTYCTNLMTQVQTTELSRKPASKNVPDSHECYGTSIYTHTHTTHNNTTFNL